MIITLILNYLLFSNSFIIHKDQTKEIKNVTVFGYQILNNIDFYNDFISPSSPNF